MHLKAIRANGFKSFADKIEIEIKNGITAIVGPNGSGKSNILDAVKWVLGEQSVKSLRGNNNMTDVIFGGVTPAMAQNRAVVSLVFDNSDHYLNSEFSELEIKRVVYRSGENEYYLNNSKCRLKDITELFTDSGAGKESFNIISQGAVGDIISSKPEDRRPIFEEAAGVLKYKKRKEESLKKLEKTKENLEKVELLISELETSLIPLKEQSAKAQTYIAYKEELENIEVALITNDIKEINVDYEKAKLEVERLKNVVASLETTTNNDISKIEQKKLLTIKIDENINQANTEVLNLTTKLASLQAQKQVIFERQQLNIDRDSVTKQIIIQKEQQLALNNQVSNVKTDIANILRQKEKLAAKIETEKERLGSLQTQNANLNESINRTDANLQRTINSIAIIEENIANNSRLPYPVKNILNNPRLKGIHNTIANLITIEENYLTAIDTALGANSSVLVVDNEQSAKQAIEYLKDNKLGRATFFPLNIIKARKLDQETTDIVTSIKGFIGIASDLVKYDKQYTNIIQNQLGNIIVVENIDALNIIGKKISYRYRIVTLDGEIQYSGGALSGGTSKSTSSPIKDNRELSELQHQKLIHENSIKNLNNNLEDNQKELRNIKEIIENLTLELVKTNEQYNLKNNELTGLEAQEKEVSDNIYNNESQLSDKVDEAIETIIESIAETSALKDNKTKQIEQLKSEKSDLFTEIAELENQNRLKNSNYHREQNNLKEQEIRLSKMDIRLDNLLLNLNENYSLTYEMASSKYTLDLDIETARLKVASLKSDITSLGVVNLGAPEEYERINTRYELLTSQKTEIEKSVSELLNLITEMDSIMVTRFIETFNQIETEFSKVFHQLFKGGKGILKLTDPDNLLTTGIEIIAEPPGKKLNSIALLSGGEKTLTAIALLFSILNIKTVPFCILDEVEAALDEANVDAFGKYLKEKKDNSQFIIITHKKKTMEYADILYGITMQESGVSKLVSVKLEE